MATSARRVKIPFPDLTTSQKTYLNVDYTSGTTLTVENNTFFAASQIAVVGNPGDESTESQSIASITASTTITLDNALNFTHNKGLIVYSSEYDQAEISNDPDGTGWVVIATVAIQWDQKETVYVDSGATDAYSYRFRFKNSSSSNFSEYSPTLTGAGFTKFQVGYMVQNIRKVVADPDCKIVSDFEIFRFLTEAKDIVRGSRNDWWFWKNFDEGTIATVAATDKYNLDDISTSVDYIAEIFFRYVSGTSDNIWPIDSITDLEWHQRTRDQNRPNNDNINSYRILPPDSSSTSGYIQTQPKFKGTGTGSFYVNWYENEADYTSVASTTSIPIPQIMENYAIAQIEQIKGNEEKANLYSRLFYGPGDRSRKNARLTGIALLEQMQIGRGKAVKQPQSLLTFKGRHFQSRVYSPRRPGTDDANRINFWSGRF